MTLAWLQRAYLRRVQFEARVLAGEVGRMLGGTPDYDPAQARSDQMIPGSRVRGNDGKAYTVTTAEGLMAHAGMGIAGLGE